ncbi:DNA replication/repair protein RecF [Candidatus Hydrogenedentota bacterium]
MRVRTIKAVSLRNIDSLELNPGPGINVFQGKNAQGKTSILEGLYLLSTSKSHRNCSDSEIMKWGKRSCFVGAEVVTSERKFTVGITINVSKKSARVNGSPLARLSELIGKLSLVMSSPEDLYLIKGAPSLRRRYMDMILSSSDPPYLGALMQYNKGAKQKSALLRKNRNLARIDLDVWNEQLASSGAFIALRRAGFIDSLRKIAVKHHGILSGNAEELNIRYSSQIGDVNDHGLENIKSELSSLFARSIDKEIEKGRCLVGIQRDDLYISISGNDLRSYGSQGQQKTAALAMRMAERHVIHEKTGEMPVVLIDDLTSELDAQRVEQFISIIGAEGQTFITTTDASYIKGLFPDSVVFDVVNGKVKRHGSH